VSADIKAVQWADILHSSLSVDVEAVQWEDPVHSSVSADIKAVQWADILHSSVSADVKTVQWADPLRKSTPCLNDIRGTSIIREGPCSNRTVARSRGTIIHISSIQQRST
jgi:hypothetical protein